jgi:hypothetical protein
MALKANMVIDQGASFSATVEVTDDNDDVINLTGYTANAQMRKHYTSLTAYSFSTSISPTTGVVTLSMNANTTNTISPGRYMYDCELTSDVGTIIRIIEGIVTVTPGVTR